MLTLYREVFIFDQLGNWNQETETDLHAPPQQVYVLKEDVATQSENSGSSRKKNGFEGCRGEHFSPHQFFFKKLFFKQKYLGK